MDEKNQNPVNKRPYINRMSTPAKEYAALLQGFNFFIFFDLPNTFALYLCLTPCTC